VPRKKSKPSRPPLQRVSIRAERREQIDWDRFAWALLQHARIVSEQEAGREAGEGEDEELPGTTRPKQPRHKHS
jgi:hypothetical protein